MTELAKTLWLQSEPTKKVMDALSQKGALPRFVGGCVRDSLLDPYAQAREIDIAIDCPPEETMALLEAAGIKPIPIGLKHGTVACVVEKQDFEITTLRQDITTDGRHAEVAFTQDWIEDAKRRDFTINALYADKDGTLYDPLNGQADLHQGQVRFIGDATKRIEEDYLRILRFFRFFATLAQGDIDKTGLSACSAMKEGLGQLSAERIQNEFLRLLVAPRAPEALRLMAASGILSFILPHTSGCALIEKMHRLMSMNFLPLDPVRLFAALYEKGEDALADGKKIKLSNKVMERLAGIFAPDLIPVKSYLSIREVRKLLYRLDVETFSDKVWRGWARDENLSAAIGWRALLALADSWERPAFPLTGQMVRAAGVAEGKEFGEIIREVEDWWIDADFIEDEFSLIERLKAVVQAKIYMRRA